MNPHEAVRLIVKKYAWNVLSSELCIEFKNQGDLEMFAQTWLGVVIGWKLEVDYVKLTTGPHSQTLWVTAGHNDRCRMWCVGFITGCTDAGTVTFSPLSVHPFSIPHRQRLWREVMYQRLQTLIGATISPQSCLARARRHRLFDRNILISVLPLYLKG